MKGAKYSLRHLPANFELRGWQKDFILSHSGVELCRFGANLRAPTCVPWSAPAHSGRAYEYCVVDNNCAGPLSRLLEGLVGGYHGY